MTAGTPPPGPASGKLGSARDTSLRWAGVCPDRLCCPVKRRLPLKCTCAELTAAVLSSPGAPPTHLQGPNAPCARPRPSLLFEAQPPAAGAHSQTQAQAWTPSWKTATWTMMCCRWGPRCAALRRRLQGNLLCTAGALHLSTHVLLALLHAMQVFSSTVRYGRTFWILAMALGVLFPVLFISGVASSGAAQAALLSLAFCFA